MSGSADISEFVALRHTLHAHAELAGREIETSRIIQTFVGEYGPARLITGLGGHGLAAVFEGVVERPSNEGGRCHLSLNTVAVFWRCNL